MFSDKKEKSMNEPGTGQNRINEGTNIKGDIHSKGFFRIDGTIEGNVNTPSKVVIGRTGKIDGTLTCENADIEGTFDGNLNVSGTLTLKETAHIEGDVVVGKLAVEPGATFNATCRMKGANSKKQTAPSSENETAEATKNHPYDRQQRLKKTSGETSK
ncbi:MAG: polymer-forming cytoskeletal protein [Flavobacteriales bacterium]|jgi:cytoskeletal protein CcmA (bactofilin family)|uniref:bactofilin family protein n=1 Tax=Candidatus Ulvibacter alkanivorans TaxID=2267620 RepID=UPI000DF4A4F9|nr:polymer-forming cytoskeletal protein [Candidatus Ulvibacter alkanivorans]MCH2489924.1 polymer-forming cytoskeletal protein [Flavobacteriales bacterium]